MSSRKQVRSCSGSIKIYCGVSKMRLLRIALALFILAFILASTSDSVSAAQVIESTGPAGYGWQQVYTDATPFYRITGSSDRQFYDWGYKNVSIAGRLEQYWNADCGWWYVTAESTLNITMLDAAGDYLVINESATTSKGQTGGQIYNWNTNDDDPGRWTVRVWNETGALNATFYIYVRGQLQIGQISTTSSPQVGNPITINANLQDNAGNSVNGSAVDNEGNSVVPTVTAYITGGGENFEISLDDPNDDGIWNGTSPNLQKLGDHKIIVKASDGHQYWVDGRGSTTVSVSGSFPYASSFGGSAVKIIVMILLSLFLLKHPQAAPFRKAAAFLIFMGAR